MIWRYNPSGNYIDYCSKNGKLYCKNESGAWISSYHKTIEEIITLAKLHNVAMEILHAPTFPEEKIVAAGQCCPTPFPAYRAGRYYCENCGVEDKGKNDQLDLFDYYVPPAKTSGRCTCGSSAVGSDRHSDYCDLYRKS